MSIINNFSEGVNLKLSSLNKYFADLFVYRQLNQSWGLKNFREFDFEPELKLLPEFIEEGSTVIDIGANMGYYLYAFNKSLKCKHIYAFEPIPELNSFIKSYFKNVLVSEYALSDSEGEDFIKIPYIKNRRYFSRATLSGIKEINENYSKKILIKKTTLDKFSEKNNLENIHLIKIDVEGHEQNVLNGGIETINRFRPVMQIEIEQRHHVNHSIESIFELLKNMNYCAYFFYKPEFRFCDINEFSISANQNMDSFGQESYIANFFFFPHEKKEKFDTIMRNIEQKIKMSN